MRARLHPIFLDLAGRRVVVVGAGTVGARKAFDLVAVGADVVVVAPTATGAVRDAAGRGLLHWEARSFVESDLDGAWLVVTATGRPEVDAEVARAAGSRRLFVNAVDDTASATAYAGGILRRGALTIAISSGGRAPALVRLVREALEQVLPDGASFDRWLELAERLRGEWRRSGVPLAERTQRLLGAMNLSAATANDDRGPVA